MEPAFVRGLADGHYRVLHVLDLDIEDSDVGGLGDEGLGIEGLGDEDSAGESPDIEGPDDEGRDNADLGIGDRDIGDRDVLPNGFVHHVHVGVWPPLHPRREEGTPDVHIVCNASWTKAVISDCLVNTQTFQNRRR